MDPSTEAGRRPLTICAIGSSASAHVVNRVRCFVERGHRVYLISEARAGIDGVTEVVPSEARGQDLPLVKVLNALALRCFRRPFPHRALLGLLLDFLSILKQCQPDIVHVHYAYSGWAWMAVVAARHPLVVSIMGGDVLFEEQGSPTPRGRWLTRELLRAADLITSKSTFLIGVLDGLGGFGAKAIRVVWGGDLKRFRKVDADALRASLGLSRDQPVILSPKILRPLYNVHLLIEAMPDIVAACPGATLLVTEYGADPHYRQAMAARIQQLGLGARVKFVGHIPQEDMPRYYSLADVSAAVPSSDGLPQTLLEGMACEVPNILSRLPRYEEVVSHEESAYFVDIEPRAIARGVIRILRDAELRDRLVRRAADIVAVEGDFEADVARVEAEYYRLLAGPRRRTGYATRVRVLWQVVKYWTGS